MRKEYDPSERLDREPPDSRFDSIPPLQVKDFSAKDYITALKESRWNCDYSIEYYKKYFGVKTTDELLYSDETISLATSLVVRSIFLDFVKNKDLKIERTTTITSDGEFAAEYQGIEIAPDDIKNCLVYGDFLLSNGPEKYIVHMEAGYKDNYKLKIISKKTAVPDSASLMKDLIKYSKENNFLKGNKIDPSCNFIKLNKKYGWNDLILSESIKDDIKKNILNLIESREIYNKNGLQVKRGLILSGAPGTGKTSLFKVLCNEIAWTILWVSPKHLQGGAKQVAQIVSLAKELAPTILLLEDIDLYAGDRASNANPALLGEMLNQLDGVQENTDIITIATTNNKEILEKALLDRPGRFDKVIEFPLPDYKERLQMLKVFSNGLVDETFPFLDEVAKTHSEKLSGAQVRELVNMAVIFAIDEKSYDENKKLILTEVHFKKAIKAVKNKDFSKMTGFSTIGTSSSIGLSDYLDD